MEVKVENTADEVKRLQSCMNDLISVLALAAIWSGKESGQMIGTLLDALLGILRLEFACARLNDSIDGSPIEVIRFPQRQHPSAQPQEVGRALDGWLSGIDQTTQRLLIPNPAGEGTLAIASFSLGLQDKVGVLVVGSRRADFPTDIERLLLRVAANQAAIGLQEARRLGEQKRVAEALERRVAERTSQLTAVNEELRNIQAYLAEAQRLSHTGSFGWRPSTGEILWSKETFRIFQYDQTTRPSDDIIRKRLHPEDIAFVKETWESSCSKGSDVDFEHRLLMPDGSVKYVHIVAHAMQDGSGDTEYVGAIMDITSRRRAEDELNKSENKYRGLLDLSPDAIYMTDSAGNLVSANPAGLEMLRCTAHEAAGMSMAETYLPEELPAFRDRVEKIHAGGRLRYERTFVRKDGSQLPVEVSGSSGSDGYFLGLIRDISERKSAETKLRRSETYLAEAQKLSRTGSWASSADLSETTYWSEEMFQIMGFPVGDPPPPNEVRKSFSPEAWSRILELVETIRQKKITCDGEFPMILRDGSQRMIRMVAHPVLDASGNIVEFVGTTIDITEQLRARTELEEALAKIRKSEDQLRVIIDTIPTLSWSTQPDGSVEFISHSWLDYTGLSMDEALNWGWSVVLHDEDSTGLMDKWRAALATGERFEAETRFRRADGEYRWCICRAVPLRDETGNIVQWYGTTTEIEDRKRAESELQKAQAELAHVTRVMTMGELVASIAHEVNQPLGAIVTNGHACVRLLSRDEPDVEKSLEVIGRMIRDGMRASEVIKRIRELLHKAAPEKTPLNINETILEVIALVSSDVLRAKVELLSELAVDLPPVVGDRIQLQQVILNLILNAKDAMSSIQNGPCELRITSRKSESGELVVAVRDSGPGLDPKDLEQIFDPFFTTKAEGMGLGLSISRTIIESHGGKLWATPNEDQGATMQFSLPLGSGSQP